MYYYSFGREEERRGLNTGLSLTSNESLLWEKMQSKWVFQKAATDPSAGISLTHWLTKRHSSPWLVCGKSWRLSASPFTVLYLVLRVTQPLRPWSYRGLWLRRLRRCSVACSFLLSILYKTELYKQRDSVSPIPGWALILWWNHSPGRWEEVSPCSAPGQRVHFWRCGISGQICHKTPQHFVDASDSRKNIKTIT